MLENIRQSFKGIFSHKLRSFLTMLGIIIGIAAIIVIASTIEGTNAQIKQNLIGSGNNTVRVRMTRGGAEVSIYDSNSVPTGVPQVSAATLKSILALDEVESVTAYTSRTLYEPIYYLETYISDPTIYGIDENYFKTLGYGIKTGRGFVEEDYTNYRTVCILDETAAQSLFGTDDPLGKTIELYATPLTVVGVVTEKDVYELTIETVEDYENYVQSDTSSGEIYIPDATWPILFNYDEPENVTVRAASTDDMTAAGRKTASLLNEALTNTGSGSTSITYAAEDLSKNAAGTSMLADTTQTQMIWIAGIALLVGGIGVANIMLVSVRERTKEIGLKKAIGAPKRTIMAQFLTEAIVLCMMGGLIGVAAGAGVAELFHRVNNVATGFPTTLALIAVAASAGIGILAGYIPAATAADLDPIEALRRE